MIQSIQLGKLDISMTTQLELVNKAKNYKMNYLFHDKNKHFCFYLFSVVHDKIKITVVVCHDSI